jgi:hypothetical protein
MRTGRHIAILQTARVVWQQQAGSLTFERQLDGRYGTIKFTILIINKSNKNKLTVRDVVQ